MNPCSELSFDPRRRPWDANFFCKKKETEELEDCTAKRVVSEAMKQRTRNGRDPTEPSRDREKVDTARFVQVGQSDSAPGSQSSPTQRAKNEGPNA